MESDAPSLLACERAPLPPRTHSQAASLLDTTETRAKLRWHLSLPSRVQHYLKRLACDQAPSPHQGELARGLLNDMLSRSVNYWQIQGGKTRKKIVLKSRCFTGYLYFIDFGVCLDVNLGRSFHVR